jgi:phosphoribosyl 1,2-cyclic phosphate phosphodiesterase
MENTAKSIVTILGSGTSTGVPMVGCSCKVCTSLNTKDKRFRTSILIESAQGNNILIDTTPDLRTQLLTHSVKKIDAAIITHDHADHLHGIDDLRPYCFGPPIKKIPIVAERNTAMTMTERFPYIFKADEIFSKERPIIGGGIPLLDLRPVIINDDDIVEIDIVGEKIKLFNLPHGHSKTTGIIHEKMAYIPDCHHISDQIVEKLSNISLDLLIIDCLQYDTHETHLNIDACFGFIRTMAPKRAILIHMNHEVLHNDLEKIAKQEFGTTVFPAYDGLKLTYLN